MFSQPKKRKEKAHWLDSSCLSLLNWDGKTPIISNRWEWFKSREEGMARSKWVEIFNKNVRMPGGSGLLAIVTSSSSSSRCPPKWKWMRLDAICFRINRGWARKVSSLQQRLALQNFIIIVFFVHPLNFLFVYATIRHHTNSCKISIQKLDIIFPTINTFASISNFSTILDIHLPCLLCKIIVIRVRYL